jgi:parvulin-like peptidyl-prolyl isomerase
MWTAVGAVALLLAACGDAARPAAAVVNGHRITVADVSDALDRFQGTDQFDQLAQQSGEGNAKRQFQQAYLAQQIRRFVLRPEAEEAGVEVTDDQVDQRLEEIKGQFPSEQEFDKALEDQGFSVAELSGLVRDQLIEAGLREKVTEDVEPSDEDLRDYYADNRKGFRQTRVQHILVENEKLAARLSRRLMEAPRRRVEDLFGRLAKRHSTDPSSNKGGELGWVSPGQLVAPFQAAMDALRIGAVSDPVPTEFGVHVIRVTDRRQQSFDSVRDQISQQVGATGSEEAWRDWLAGVYADAEVEVNSRYGELDPATGQIVNASAEQVPGAESPSPEPTEDSSEQP